MLPDYRDHRPPMLSSAVMWDTGSHGGLDGTYSMKVATRARAGHQAVTVKRFTWRELGLIQLEAYFTCKPEPSTMRLGSADVRGFGLLLDLQNDEKRFIPHLRYLNALDGEPRGVWQYRTTTPPRVQTGPTGQISSVYHLHPEGWKDIPDGRQALCYNELPTKLNWHYLRILVDLRAGNYLEFQCNDRTYDLSQLGLITAPTIDTLPCLLNAAFFIEAGTDRRALLYVNSVVLSTDV